MASVNSGQSPLIKDAWTVNELSHELPLARSGREVVEHAQVIAAGAGAARVEPEHLLLSVLSLQNGLAARALKALGKNLDSSVLSARVGQAIAEAPGRSPVGPAARYVLYNALKEAQLLGHYRVDSLHILLGLLYKGTPTAEQLEKQGLSLYDLRQFMQAPGPGVAGLRRRPLPSLHAAISVSPIFAIPVAGFLGVAWGSFWDQLPRSSSR